METRAEESLSFSNTGWSASLEEHLEGIPSHRSRYRKKMLVWCLLHRPPDTGRKTHLCLLTQDLEQGSLLGDDPE
jgi:hypothetical protein